MNVTKITQGGAQFDPFLLDALAITKPDAASNAGAAEAAKPKGWEKQILMDALDKLENNIKVEDNSPLNYASAAPIETFAEAKAELKKLVNVNFSDYAAQAQANLTPADILYLFEEESSFVV